MGSGAGGSMTGVGISGGTVTGGSMTGGNISGGSITVSKTNVGVIGVQMDTTYQCTPGSNPNCCPTMIPPSFLAPDDSTCWQWWDPPANGIMKQGMPSPQKGCDYEPCKQAVCACDSYCCN